MSNIVKSLAVVDDRARRQRTLLDVLEEAIDETPVIKRRVMDYRENPYLDETLVLPDKQGYLDELNRIKVEISEGMAELRRIRRETGEAIEEEARKALEEQEARARDVPSAKAEAERILGNAKSEASAIVVHAQAEAVRMREEAENSGYLEGFDRGFAQAIDEFKTENNPKMEQLSNLLEELSSYREEMIARNEHDLLDVVFAVAEKIVCHEIKADPRAVALMLYKTLDDNRREEHVRITMSADLMPADAKVSADVKKTILAVAKDALIYAYDDLEEGTCIVETDKGITDLSVGTQLENARKLLEEE